MISFANKALLLISGIFSLVAVLSTPLDIAKHNISGTASKFINNAISATPAAPHFVIYSDAFVSGETGPPPVSTVQGFNVFILSFLLTEGAFDKAAEWTQLTAAQRSSVKSQYAAAGIKILVSLFGSTDAPTSSGADPVATANTMAAWVIQFGLDGVDVDYEDFNAINAGNGKAEAWIATFTKQLRTQLPQGTYILTHAPVAPWFSPGMFGGGAYLTVDSTVGSLIDWYNVQFYNQGSNEYTTCSGLLTQSSSTWPKSAVFQIAASGIPLSKLVIGKPATTSDASNGFMSTSTLAGCLVQAKNQGWDAGVMVWEYPDAKATWIQAVRAQAFPTTGSVSNSLNIHPVVNNAKCIGILGGAYVNGAAVDIFDCNQSNTQLWQWNGDSLVSVAPDGSQWCLDSGVQSTWTNGLKMKIWQCLPNLPQQTWTPDTSSGAIQLTTANFCLDLTSGITTNQNVLQIWACTAGDQNQIWTVTPA